MKRSEKVDRIVRVLDETIPEVPIPLNHVDPFTLLVAVLLSAQTTDKKVNEVTPGLFERGGDPASMAKMTVEEIRDLISVIGLAPTKARNLKTGSCAAPVRNRLGLCSVGLMLSGLSGAWLLVTGRRA